MRGWTRWTDSAIWDPLGELMEVAEAFDRAFAELGFPAGVSKERGLLDRGSAADLRFAADDDGYEIAMDLPGVAKDSLEVECAGDTVTIRGEWPEPAVGDGAMVWRRERPRGRFVRTLSLGDLIDSNSASAKLEDGVLHVRVKKASEARSRQIKVKS